MAKVQAELSAKRAQLQSLQSDAHVLNTQRNQAEQSADQLQQQYKGLIDAARAEGNAGAILDLQAQLTALQQQCGKVCLQVSA